MTPPGRKPIFAIPIPRLKSPKKRDLNGPPKKWNCQIPRFQKLQKQVSLLRSRTLCVQGSAQKQDVAEPPCRPPSLTLCVHGAREGPVPRAQVSSLLALPCPLPGASDPLGGVGSLPFPSSPDGITAVDLVKPRAPKVAETGQPIEVPHAVRIGVSAEAGRGRATVLKRVPKVAETTPAIALPRALLSRTGEVHFQCTNLAIWPLTHLPIPRNSTNEPLSNGLTELHAGCCKPVTIALI